MSVILDAGALIAADRNDRAMWRRLKAVAQDGDAPLTHGGVVGQVWRGGPRQASLARCLSTADVRALDDSLGRSAGVLLGRTRTADVVDSAIAVLAADGDVIYTSDPEDLALLCGARGVHVDIVPV